MIKKLHRVNFFIIWLTLLIVNTLLRLPHFLSKNLFIDEDEAIIGIMGQDILSGEGISYYFYGQNYGLSIFESLSVAGCIPIFGNTFWAIKMGALILFTLGLTFLVKAILHKNLSPIFTFSLILLLSTFPTWYLWGAMPRGGYVTAFASASAIYYLTQINDKRFWVTPTLALLTYITYDAHSFLILPILPFLFLWWLEREKKIRDGFIFASIIISLLLLAQTFLTHEEASNRISLEMANISFQNLIIHLKSWDHAFSGFYYFFQDIDPPAYWANGIYIMSFLGSTYLIFLCIKGWKLHWKLIISFVFTLFLGLIILSTIDIQAPRYMIGLYTLLLFQFIFFITNVRTKLNQSALIVLTLISIIGITAGSKINRHWLPGDYFAISLNETYEYAKKRKTKAVFALDHQFVWNYLHGHEIPASSLCWTNRTSYYSNKVKQVYKKNPEQVLLFGFRVLTFDLEKVPSFSLDTTNISNNIFVLNEVNDTYLKKGRLHYICSDNDPSKFD